MKMMNTNQDVIGEGLITKSQGLGLDDDYVVAMFDDVDRYYYADRNYSEVDETTLF